MQTLIIFLQFGAKMDDSLSSFQLFSIWGFFIVFIALFIFFLIRTDKLINAGSSVQTEKPSLEIGQVSDEEAAAIAMAIYMYKVEMHDKESLTITLKKVSRIYSPWSSKIYTLRQNPR